MAQCSAWQLWGFPRGKLRGLWARMREGWHFAFGQSAQMAHLDLDKALLPRLASLEAAGIYTAAFRFAAVAYLPLNAFESAIYPRFFQAGQRSLAEARRFAEQTLCVTAVYGLVAAACLWVVAPWLLRFSLGHDFAGSVAALRWLAVLPLLQSLYLPLADALTGSGRQAWRTGGQLGALLVSAGLNWWLIPQAGWRGAAWAMIVSHVVFGICVLARSRKA
jgi:O-antigen/teichoic acid export membrane protein